MAPIFTAHDSNRVTPCPADMGAFWAGDVQRTGDWAQSSQELREGLFIVEVADEMAVLQGPMAH